MALRCFTRYCGFIPHPQFLAILPPQGAHNETNGTEPKAPPCTCDSRLTIGILGHSLLKECDVHREEWEIHTVSHDDPSIPILSLVVK